MTAMTRCLDRPGFMPRLSLTICCAHAWPSPCWRPRPGSNYSARRWQRQERVARRVCVASACGCQVYWLPLNGAALSPLDLCLRLAQNLGLTFTDETTLLLDLSRWQASAWLFLDDFLPLADARDRRLARPLAQRQQPGPDLVAGRAAATGV